MQAGSGATRKLPWRRPRQELLLLVLVGVAVLSPVVAVNAHDQSNLCLSDALLHVRVSSDTCFSGTIDHASYGGHLYSDKAPGLSALATPATALVRPHLPVHWGQIDARVWLVRLFTVGLAFVLCAFAVGRVSEGLAPGYGGISMVAFALGTLVAPLGVVLFDAVVAAALAFACFLLAWGGRPGLAGLVGGTALLVQYQTGLALIAIGCYVALAGGRHLLAFLGATLPCGAVLAAYDWAAFGRPWHLSYRYVANYLAGEQTTGFFGIGVPHRFGVIQVLAGHSGLLVVSPVLAAAAFGLVHLARTHLAEAVVAAAVSGLFVLLNAGYFDPYGGLSPGPRFLVAGLPFLALGLGPAFSRWPRTTLALTVLSVVPTTVLVLTWSHGHPTSGTVWAGLVRLPIQRGSSWFVDNVVRDALSWLGPGPLWGALLVALCAAGAVIAGARSMPWAQPAAWRRSSGRLVFAAVVSGYLIVAADVLALTNYPYGVDPQIQLVKLLTSVSGIPDHARPGEEVRIVVSVADRGTVGAAHLLVTIVLPPGTRLNGPPGFTQGSGCSGSSRLVCNLDALSAHTSTRVWFGVVITAAGDETVTSWSSAQGDPRSNVASFTVSTDS